MKQTGLLLGTQQYMSPEQAAGEKMVDARSGNYALSAVTGKTLVDDPPFTGPSTLAIVARLLSSAPPSRTATRNTVPPHRDAVVLTAPTALVKLPADRQASVGEFAAQLTGAAPMAFTQSNDARQNPGPVGGDAYADARRTERALRGTRMLLGATAVLALAAVGAVGWLTTRPTVVTPVRTFLLTIPGSTTLNQSHEQPTRRKFPRCTPCVLHGRHRRERRNVHARSRRYDCESRSGRGTYLVARALS